MWNLQKFAENIYPNTEWLPSEGVQRGSIMIGNGDPLSPLYPSKKNSYRSKTIEEVSILFFKWHSFLSLIKL